MRSNAASGNEGEGDSVLGCDWAGDLLNDCAQLLTMLLRSSFPEYPAGAIVIERSSSSVLQREVKVREDASVLSETRENDEQVLRGALEVI